MTCKASSMAARSLFVRRSAASAASLASSASRASKGDAYALVYQARVGSQPFEEAQLLRLDDEARIKEITLFGRPMPALTTLMITLGPEPGRPERTSFTDRGREQLLHGRRRV
jgi:hypothetical protein